MRFRSPSLRVEGLGPIRSGEVRFKPLTIFIGPNNSGKSYMAMFVQALNNTLGNPHSYPFEVLDRVREKVLSEIRITATSWQRRVASDKLQQLLKRALQEASVKEAFPIDSLIREIERTFTARISDVINYGADVLNISVKSDVANYSLSITRDGDNNVKEFSLSPDRLLKIARLPRGYYTWEILPHILSDTLSSALPLFPRSFFLPAARSGILQAHRAIASAIVSISPRIPVATEEIVRIPRLTGVVADFINILLTISEQEPRYIIREEFSSQRKLLEGLILEGEVELRREAEALAPEFFYKVGDRTIPLVRTSSMISELAPLDLYLKYVLVKDSLVIIEEPEAHLHPHKQKLIARLLVKMVRGGLNVLITTHSDFLLAQLNNHILLSKVSKEERKVEGYDEEDYLNPEEVGAYLFEKIDNWYEIKELTVSEGGIPEEEFVRVAETIGNEQARIHYKAFYV